MCTFSIYHYARRSRARARAPTRATKYLLAFPSVAGAWNISSMSKVVNPLARAKITVQSFPRSLARQIRAVFSR